MADDPDLIRQAIPDLKAQLSAALEDLRALARGIYPPLLAEQGLVMALRAQAARSPVPVTLEAEQVGRYRQDAESTVYFCTLEALQNVAKHARASRATVRLSGSGGTLEFSVSDNGAGFAAAADRPRLGPAGHVRPAGRARRHPGRPLPARPGHHHHRPVARIGADGRSRVPPGQPGAELIMRVRTKGERSYQCRPERSGNPHTPSWSGGRDHAGNYQRGIGRET